jgi:hypothetical protein
MVNELHQSEHSQEYQELLLPMEEEEKDSYLTLDEETLLEAHQVPSHIEGSDLVSVRKILPILEYIPYQGSHFSGAPLRYYAPPSLPCRNQHYMHHSEFDMRLNVILNANALYDYRRVGT